MLAVGAVFSLLDLVAFSALNGRTVGVLGSFGEQAIGLCRLWFTLRRCGGAGG